MDAATILTSLGGALLTGGGMAALVGALSRRRVVKADAAETLTDSALELVNALKADAKAVRDELTATRQEMATVRVEAESLAGRLRSLIAAIHDPVMTLERLRAMAPAGGVNGSGRS